MFKAGKLTKSELFYIEQNPENKTIHELSKELNRSPNMIAKHWKQPVAKQEEAKPIANPDSAMFKLMGRHERQGKHVATIMTKSASELADTTRPQRLKDKNKLDSAIHKPKG